MSNLNKTKNIPPSEQHITPEAMPSTGLTGPSESATYYVSDWFDSDIKISGVTGPTNLTNGSIAIGSSSIAIGSTIGSNIAYGSYITPSTGSYITVGGGIPLTNDFSYSGSYTYPATCTVTTTIPYNDEQNDKIEKLEERIKELETKLEKILEMIEDKTIYKISI